MGGSDSPRSFSDGDVFKSNVLFGVSDCVVCIHIVMHGDVFKSNVLYCIGISIEHTLL